MEVLVVNNSFWENKKVLVTGHTGFKGSWLCQWLISMGAEVSGLALQPNTTPSLFELLSLEKKMGSYIGNIQNFSVVDEVVQKTQPQIIFHLAAQPLVLYSYDEPLETYMTNVIGTANLFESIRKHARTSVIVNVTTDKCYENKEWEWGYRENEPMGGHDPYSSSKGCSELLTTSYQKSYFDKANIRLASARAGNVIGGGDWSENRLVPDVIKSLTNKEPIIIRNPASIRPWQHVLEPLAGYLLLAEKLYQKESGSQYIGAYNFGPFENDVKPVSWITETLCDLWKGEASWKLDKSKDSPHEATYLKLDCSKSRKKLHWQPALNLNQALEWIVEWSEAYCNNDDMDKITSYQISKYEQLTLC